MIFLSVKLKIVLVVNNLNSLSRSLSSSSLFSAMSKICIKKKSKATARVHNVGFKMETCEMYQSLRWLMRVTRWFGLFPVEGLDSDSISGLRFKIKSFYFVFWFVSCFGLLAMSILSFWGLATTKFSLSNMSHAVFYALTFASTVMLFVWAKYWPGLLKEVAEIERKIIVNLDSCTSTNMFRLNVFLLVCGVVEHVLCYIYVVNFAMKCFQVSITDHKVMKMLFTLKLASLMESKGPEIYQFYTGVLFEITNAQAVFIWSLVDAIVIIHCMYLTAYFRTFNTLIESEMDNNSANWGQLRLQYARLVILVKKIDSHLSYFVLMSFSSNLFFTILQLFNTLKVQKYEFGVCNYEGAVEALTGAIHTIFYVFSFLYLVSRTVLVSLMAANVNRYACLPISALGEVRASMYDSEIQRFYRQITYTTIGVSGVFFYVTREMILKVLGTLITYELVLLQFTGISIEGNKTEVIKRDGDQTKKLTFNY